MSLGKGRYIFIALLLLAVTSQSSAISYEPCNMTQSSYENSAMDKMNDMDHSAHISDSNTTSDYCCDHDNSCSMSNCASSIVLSTFFDILEPSFQIRRTDSYYFSITHPYSSSLYRPPISA